ncbi:cation transport protein-domain-containing protein [Dipodascopsis uninucleata]
MIWRRVTQPCIDLLVSILKPRFILFHVIYICGISLLGSVLIFAQRNLAYIDALFMACAAATQAGLNTVDLDSLSDWQQIVLFIIALLTNPIIINSFLVFVRLYWFEKAFENIRLQSYLDHRLRKARSIGVEEPGDIEQFGVGSRPIRVLHSARMTESNFPGYRTFNYGDLRNRDSIDDDGKHIYGCGPKYTTEPERNNSNGDDSTLLKDLGGGNIDNLKKPNSDASASTSSEMPSSSTSSNMSTTADKVENTTAVKDSGNISRDIRSGDLPTPRQYQDRRTSMDDGPPLVIKSPREQERDFERAEKEKKDIKFGSLPSPKTFHSRSFSLGEHGPTLVIKSPREQEIESQNAAEEARKQGIADHPIISPISGIKEFRPFKRKTSETKIKSEPVFDEDDDVDDHDNNNDDTGRHVRRVQSNITSADAKAKAIYSSPAGHKVDKRAITIEAPEQTRSGRTAYKRSGSFGELFRRTGTIDKMERLFARTLSRRRDSSPARSMTSRRSGYNLPYLSYEPTIARNSIFVGLTEDQREELGGVEYRALRTLAAILIFYFFGFLILALIMIIPWILRSKTYIRVPEKYDLKPAWWGTFAAVSSYTNLGLSLVPTSMMEFQFATFPLLAMPFFIIIGNTGFPCMLRLSIWIIHKFYPSGSAMKESLSFLLDHPRRCFTLLFPSKPTWWLFFVLVALNATDTILFIILDIDNTMFDGWSGAHKILNGFFQAVSTRVCGLASVDISALHPAVQVSYMVMMYISVLPIAISVRRTNVYEEQSLGIYKAHGDDDDEDFSDYDSDNDDDDDDEDEGADNDGHNEADTAVGNGHAGNNQSYSSGARQTASSNELSRRPTLSNMPSFRGLTRIPTLAKERRRRRRKAKKEKNKERGSFITNHLRRQLSFDLWYITIGLFIICIADGPKIRNTNDYSFSIFAVLFEVVSAYGTVGLSFGYPNSNASLSAQFNKISKFTTIMMMLRGRHRGLPYRVDRAILLPSESLAKKDLKQENMIGRRPSTTSGRPQLHHVNIMNRMGSIDDVV